MRRGVKESFDAGALSSMEHVEVNGGRIVHRAGIMFAGENVSRAAAPKAKFGQ
jgi:hypothetical protein